LQVGIVATLRAAGVDCYDFRNPRPGDHGFSWKSIDGGWESWTVPQWRSALEHEIALVGFANDFDAMNRADCCVLVLPCGRSAHLEAGYMAGQGKPVFTLALDRVEPELMTLLLGPSSNICATMDELFDALCVPN
jgi:hypothetical protein